MLTIAFLLFFYYVIPVEVEGVVETKAINGRMSGNTGATILLNRQVPGEPWILVEDKDFEQFFSPEDRNVFINDSLHEQMDMKYVSIDYIVSIQVSSDDPVNDVRKGQTYAYYASREDFNMAEIGDTVRYRVSRFEDYRIEEILESSNRRGIVR
ncbi:hypothetical protein EFE41_10185 [Methanohalophilus portucalensis FDF-1]|uniref:Uncharacterized protein n=4 Tax=Methanohalophilus TaxID=2175 RepID=A0A285GBR4_9EURY|nr:hypothetical protein BKM01_10480 [Methanohalophilus portucalensis]OBZ34727.1 MAG: hypothetical protein A9957_02170 [Methanohalophilus sp. DAL1]ODV50161.1 MAG: hypothetical protein A8273_467 [Methanohalophilus sp. 2-GBenrich]OJH48457.1 hypothetical protein MPF_2060 [Methanohalophilus portucalensis FDF-1]RXG34484.1 hypothetical protein CI957_922 [Methanohalophilus sp. WG1-DM]TCL12072.1 hypothetical protein C7960_1283 [Methanohalophilus euhalobius]